MDETPLKRLAYYLGVSKPRKVLFLPLGFFVGGFCLSLFLPRLDRYIPGGAPITQFFLEGVWLALMVFGLLGCRNFFRKKFGEKAYRAALLFFFPAAVLMVNGIVRPIWIEGHTLNWIPFALRILIGFYFLSVGFLLEARGVQTLGIDRVAFVYTIFPERGEHVKSALYQFLRHPIYAAMSHMALGAAFLAGKGEGIWCALIFILKLWIWSKIEEKELIARLGQSYVDYRKNTPAFFPKVSQMKDFLKVLK